MLNRMIKSKYVFHQAFILNLIIFVVALPLAISSVPPSSSGSRMDGGAMGAAAASPLTSGGASSTSRSADQVIDLSE